MEIGLKSLCIRGSGTFGTNQIGLYACFHCIGTVEVATDRLKRKANGLQNTGALVRRNQSGSPSKPETCLLLFISIVEWDVKPLLTRWGSEITFCTSALHCYLSLINRELFCLTSPWHPLSISVSVCLVFSSRRLVLSIFQYTNFWFVSHGQSTRASHQIKFLFRCNATGFMLVGQTKNNANRFSNKPQLLSAWF